MPRKSWLTIGAISSGSRRSRKIVAGPCSERAPLRGDDLADELVVGHVAAERVADPGVEVQDRLDPHAVGIGPEQVDPLVGPVVGVLGPLEQAIDQPRPLVGRRVGEELRGPRRRSAAGRSRRGRRAEDRWRRRPGPTAAARACGACPRRSSSMKFDRGSASYRAAGTAPGKGIVTSQLANRPPNRAEMVASPGIGPAVTRPSASTLTRADSLEANAARAVTSSAEPSVKWAVTRSANDSDALQRALGRLDGDPLRRWARPAGVRGIPAAIHRSTVSYAGLPGVSRRPAAVRHPRRRLAQQQALRRASRRDTRRPPASFTIASWSKAGSNPSSDKANPFWPRALP